MPVLSAAVDTSRDRIDLAWRAYLNQAGNPTRRSAIAQGIKAAIPVGNIGFDTRKIFEAGYYNALAMSDRLQSYIRMAALLPQDEQKARQLAGDIRVIKGGLHAAAGCDRDRCGKAHYSANDVLAINRRYGSR
jgi:hypothetical protein